MTLALLLAGNTAWKSGYDRMESVYAGWLVLTVCAGLTCLISSHRSLRMTASDAWVTGWLFYVCVTDSRAGVSWTLTADRVMLTGATYFVARMWVNFLPSARKMVWVALLLYGAVELGTGVGQWCGWIPSRHGLFRLTGFFPNPGPFACYLAVLAPLLWVVCPASAVRGGGRWIRGILLSGACVVILATGSRTGAVALLAGAAASWWRMAPRWSLRFGNCWRRQAALGRGVLVAAGMVLLLGSGWAIYRVRPVSADSRLFIWKMTARVVAAHPLLGTGTGSFPGGYARAQHDYFAGAGRPLREEQLAAAPEWAFNEYLQVMVEYGVIGVIGWMGIILSAVCALPALSPPERAALSGVLVAWGVVAFFSYPMQVPLFLQTTFLLLATAQPVPAESRNGPSGFPWSRIFISGGFAGLLLIAGLRQQERSAYLAWQRIRGDYLAGACQWIAPAYESLYPGLKHHPHFLFEWARICHHTGRYEESNRLLEPLSRYLSDPMVWNIRGRNHQAMGNSALAARYYRRALHTVPSRIYPQYLLALLYAQSGESRPAFYWASRVLTASPKVASAAVERMKEEMMCYLEQTNRQIQSDER